MAEVNLVEASIDDLRNALNSGFISSVDLVARYLCRISIYDCRNIALNAIPILNQALFDEAAASDDRRAAGESPRALEGIPYTIKDSFKVKGMTAAAGSPAFQHLVANDDAFIAKTLREAGAVLIGKTNMPAVACGGMARGIYGRAENPYNPDYLAAAFTSGSSNGSAASTAASLAAFGIGAETVSSGRSPASNNALIAYTPSRGWLSVRGNWPLYPTCDVPVPHTRSMADMFRLLDVLAIEDPIKRGEFWLEQEFVKLAKPWSEKPKSFTELSATTSLKGLRIAVPEIFIGGPAPKGAKQIETGPEVIELWEQTRTDLEALGAEIVLVPDFPALTAYENDDLLPEGCPRRPENWNAMERGALVAHSWNEFLKDFNDKTLPDLSAVDHYNIYPDSLRTEPELKYFEKGNSIQYHTLADYLKSTTYYGMPGLGDAVNALEGMRKVLLEDWLANLGCHCAVFPSAGDVGPADADTSFESAALAWKNGVFYSNGNRAIRHLGIPTVSVPMGTLREKGVPMNLTFAGPAYTDVKLLSWGNAFEAGTKHRFAPKHTPALETDIIRPLSGSAGVTQAPRPILKVDMLKVDPKSDDQDFLSVLIKGQISDASVEHQGSPQLEVTVDAQSVSDKDIKLERVQSKDTEAVFNFEIQTLAKKPVERVGVEKTRAPVARDQTMVVMLARAAVGGRPTGWLGLA